MFKKFKLKNNLTCIFVPLPQSLSITFLILVKAGLLYETKKINGISHFLEHMCFKGTKNRPSSLDISKELDSIGAQSNAFTGENEIGFYATAAKNHFEKIFDVISDIYLNPVFPSEEIEKEKGVIIEEINGYYDIPQYLASQKLVEALYGDQPAGWDIAGKKEIIKKMTQKYFFDYHKKFFVPERTVIVVAGNFKEKEMFQKIKEKFSPFKGRSSKQKPIFFNDKLQRKIIICDKKTDQIHISLGFKALNSYDSQKDILSLLVSILSGGMSSRLFQKIREKLGICYYIYATQNLFPTHGYLEIKAGLDINRTKEGIEKILEECLLLKNELVSEEEIEKAKEYLIGNFLLSLERGSYWYALYYGSQEINERKIRTPDEVVKAIRKINPHQIKKIANLIFQEKNLSLSIVGPSEIKEKVIKANLKI